MSYADSPKNYWLINKKWPKRIFWGLLAAGLLAFFLTPMYCGFSDRARVGLLIMLSSEAKGKIEQSLLATPEGKIALDAHALIQGKLNTKSEAGEEIEIPFREITAQGEIRLFSPQLGVMLILSPHLKDKKVTWSCWGRPLKKIPLACRGES